MSTVLTLPQDRTNCCKRQTIQFIYKHENCQTISSINRLIVYKARKRIRNLTRFFLGQIYTELFGKIDTKVLGQWHSRASFWFQNLKNMSDNLFSACMRMSIMSIMSLLYDLVRHSHRRNANTERPDTPWDQARLHCPKSKASFKNKQSSKHKRCNEVFVQRQKREEKIGY